MEHSFVYVMTTYDVQHVMITCYTDDQLFQIEHIPLQRFLVVSADFNVAHTSKFEHYS